MKRRQMEGVTIRVEIRRGKDVVFSALVPPFSGLRYECPEPVVMNYDGLLLWGIDVVPHVGQDTMAVEAPEPAPVLRLEEDEQRMKTKRAVEAHNRKAGGMLSRLLGPLLRDHEHAIAKTQEIPYGCCVAVETCVPAAHEGETCVDTCRCGATRYRNFNNGMEETGPWA